MALAQSRQILKVQLKPSQFGSQEAQKHWQHSALNVHPYYHGLGPLLDPDDCEESQAPFIIQLVGPDVWFEAPRVT